MGSLVVCCDGTWQNAVVQALPSQTNIKRIVDEIDRTKLKKDPEYVKGVGTGGLVDRLLGGAFGQGLDGTLLTAYLFLVDNYESDPEPDKVYIFGFSRGAYTARSLAGMIGKIGLLRKEHRDKAKDALDLYRASKGRKERQAKFVPDCHPIVKIEFLGVFDTVGALGVPGISSKRYEWHDVELGEDVLHARQALAIDEPRMAFEPALWANEDKAKIECERRHEMWSPGEQPPPKIKQVWFKGAHSDVGGGGERKLSDITLKWMMREAFDAGGLQFKTAPSGSITNVEGPVKRMLRAFYSVHNVIRRVRFGIKESLGQKDEVSRRFFGNGHRILCLEKDLSVALADPLVADTEYRPASLERWLKKHEQPYPTEK